MRPLKFLFMQAPVATELDALIRPILDKAFNGEL
jgi:hypothetical protein